MFEFETLDRRQLFSSVISAVPTVPDNSLTVVTASPASNHSAKLSSGGAAHLSKTGTLIVQGSAASDSIAITHTPPDAPLVTSGTPEIDANHIYVNGRVNGVLIRQIFDSSAVKRILVDAGSGDDLVQLTPDIKVKATLIGGNGNDTLVGGAKGDLISGGKGNDSLYATEATITGKPATISTLAADQQPSGGKLYVPGAKQKIKPVAYTIVPFASGFHEDANSADSLEGGAGNDTLYAGIGPDTLNGGAGTDDLVANDRATPPKNVTKADDTPVTFDGLTAISIEKTGQPLSPFAALNLISAK